MWPFNNKKKREQQRKQEVTKTANDQRVLEKYESTGLLFIDMKNGRVFISSTLSAYYMSTEAKWLAFLTHVHTWFEYRISQELWERKFRDAEAKAVREAKKKYAMLTAAQIREIRFNARAAVDLTEVLAPEIRPFDFVVTDGMVFSEKSEVVVVGYYDRGAMTMVPYAEIHENE